MRNSVATSQVGKSGHFVVKPAGFVLSTIKCTTYAAGSCATAAIASPGNNPGATTASGLAFIQAGQPFSVTVTALTVNGKTKADAGTTVNCTSTPADCTPNFGQEQSPESVGLDVTNFVAGMVTPPDLVGGFGAFSGGIASGSAFSWDEVGIITLTPAIRDNDYLGAGDVTGTVSGKIGRFFPDHFNTVVAQVSGVPMACPDGSCPATFNGIVYSGQPFSLTVTAKNLNNATTANYSTTTGFAKTTTLGPYGALGAVTSPAGAGTLGVAAVTAFTNGTLTDSTENYTFTTALTNPTNIYINASDGEASSRRATNPTTTSVEGGVRVVSGRIKIPNAYGSELQQLTLTATVQYYDGVYWTTSLTDSVTSFNTNLTTASGNLVATVRTGLPSGVTVFSPGVSPVVAGVRSFVLAAPLTSGSVDLLLNAPIYLPNIAARATFGVFKSPLIYRRENY
jgi:MSHA biogenesis protein MshQ